MNETAASDSRGAQTQTVPSRMILLVGLLLLIVGAVAAFVSSNQSASAVLIAAGAASLLVIVFGDRIQEAKFGGFEIKLAVHIKDRLRTALDLKVRGNYEGSENVLREAFDRFVDELDAQEYRSYRTSKTYQAEVSALLEQIVREKFGGRVKNSTGTGSFYPLIDAVLLLDGTVVLKRLAELNRPVCDGLVKHLQQDLRVGVTIRPGPDLEALELVKRLSSNVQNGALSATCFLLIQNCRETASGENFRALARGRCMYATSVQFPEGGSVAQLDGAITDAILTICSDELPPEAICNDELPRGVSDPITVLERRNGV
jgi:hypothetical protein